MHRKMRAAPHIRTLVVALATAGGVLLAANPAHAEPDAIDESEQATSGSESAERAPAFQGTEVTLRNAVAGRSFDRSGELTYDPLYGLVARFEPRVTFGEFFVEGDFSLSREITHSNTTTKAGEIWPSDVEVEVGKSGLWTIPGVDVTVSASALGTLPISKDSRAASMKFGVGGQLGLARSFELLEGLSLFYEGVAQKLFHEYTTVQLESSPIPLAACGQGASNDQCTRLLQTGVRNASWTQSHTGGFSLGLISSLRFSAAFGVSISHLYALEDNHPGEEQINYQSQEPTDLRHSNIYFASLSYDIIPDVTVRGMLQTVSPQLAPDSTTYEPVFNRYTMYMLDLTLNVGELAQRF